MGYMNENTNEFKVICFSVLTNIIYKTYTLKGYVDIEPIDENIYHENLNDEIIVENIGARMRINVEIINKVGANDQLDVHGLIDCIPLIHAMTHRFFIYPNWDSDALTSTLDKYECVLKSFYKIKHLHKTVKAGNSISISFIEAVPSKVQSLKIPNTMGAITPFTQSGQIVG